MTKIIFRLKGGTGNKSNAQPKEVGMNKLNQSKLAKPETGAEKNSKNQGGK